MRIISLVPSQTELLYYLGLEEEVIGITKFCIHPEKWFRNKTRVGGTKHINTALIKSLHPDLIIANKEENEKDQVEALYKDFRVHVTDVNNLTDASDMIQTVGRLVNKEQEALQLSEAINQKFLQLQPINNKQNVVYLIWKDPYMTVGGDTFINDMLNRCGLNNLFNKKQRYPMITVEELSQNNFDTILLSSEPYPFKQKHIDEWQQIFPDKRIILVDGEMFSWYGSRLLQAPEYFKKLRSEMIK